MGELKLNESGGRNSAVGSPDSRRSMQSYILTYCRHLEGTFDSPGLPSRGSFISASTVPHRGKQEADHTVMMLWFVTVCEVG